LTSAEAGDEAWVGDVRQEDGSVDEMQEMMTLLMMAE